MEILGVVILWIGVLISLIGGIWILVEAFKESIWWGLGSFFIGLVGLIFVFMHFERTKKPFFIQLAGVAMVFLGSFMLGGSN